MSLLDDAINWLSDQFSAIDESVENWSQEWQDKVDELKTKASKFSEVYSGLLNKKAIAQRDPKVSREYDALMQKGDWLKSSVQYITEKVDAVYNSFFRNTSGNQMGIVPFAAVVPVVAITGSITAISAWLSDAYILNRKLSHIETQVDKGASPEQAKGGVESTYNKGSLVNIEGSPVTGALMIGAVGLAVYFLWPKITAGLFK